MCIRDRFKCDNRVEDHKIYGGKTATYIGAGFLKKYVRRLQDDMIAAIGRCSRVSCCAQAVWRSARQQRRSLIHI